MQCCTRVGVDFYLFIFFTAGSLFAHTWSFDFPLHLVSLRESSVGSEGNDWNDYIKYFFFPPTLAGYPLSVYSYFERKPGPHFVLPYRDLSRSRANNLPCCMWDDLSL